MVIPRKSYEELQNELVEKIKQIDELTSRYIHVLVYNIDRNILNYIIFHFYVENLKYDNYFRRSR